MGDTLGRLMSDSFVFVEDTSFVCDHSDIGSNLRWPLLLSHRQCSIRFLPKQCRQTRRDRQSSCRVNRTIASSKRTPFTLLSIDLQPIQSFLCHDSESTIDGSLRIRTQKVLDNIHGTSSHCDRSKPTKHLFQPLKIYYTSLLVVHGLKREALAYCEEIGQTLIRQGNTIYIQLVDLQLFIMVCIEP